MTEVFKGIDKIEYEGKESRNPLAFKYYNAEEKVGNKTMKEHLRFAVSYWHTFVAGGNDQFGDATMIRPWNFIEDEMDLAKERVKASFEFMNKLGVEYFCFHDRDIAPEGENLKETNKNLDIIVDMIEKYMDKTNKKLLWGTANMFYHPRYVHGAATSCNADVFAYAAAQVKKAMEITKRLNGENYVFWGGREGYETLLNTDTKFELENLARFFHMAIDYAEKIGFKGQLLIEPKPKEPTKHQYDYDVQTVIGFLTKYDLDDYFKINIEANHATLAQHTFQHELNIARINNMLGSVDANQGDTLLGWDTDQFPTNVYNTTLAMYEILKNGGLHKGGLNFDAKVRRASFEPVDLFHGYIAGMDSFALGLKAAHKLLEDQVLEEFIDKRYESYSKGVGKEIINDKADFVTLEKYAMVNNKISNKSGRQELLESIITQYIVNVE